jgi:hypothetical protein
MPCHRRQTLPPLRRSPLQLPLRRQFLENTFSPPLRPPKATAVALQPQHPPLTRPPRQPRHFQTYQPHSTLPLSAPPLPSPNLQHPSLQSNQMTRKIIQMRRSNCCDKLTSLPMICPACSWMTSAVSIVSRFFGSLPRFSPVKTQAAAALCFSLQPQHR